MIFPLAYASGATFENPIASKTFEELILNISKSVLQVALVIAPVFIIIAGIRFLTAAAAGNEAGITAAKKLLWWTLIGTAIVVSAYAVATAIINFASEL